MNIMLHSVNCETSDKNHKLLKTVFTELLDQVSIQSLKAAPFRSLEMMVLHHRLNFLNLKVHCLLKSMVCVTEITHPTAVMSFLSDVTDWSIKTKQCYIFPATKGKETQIHKSVK